MHIGGNFAMAARRHPEKIGFIYENRKYTYGEFNERVNSLAWALLEMGLKKGSRIGLFMQNSDWFVMAFLAIQKIGCIAVPINYRLTLPELTYIIGNSETSLLFLDQEYLNFARELKKQGYLPYGAVVCPEYTGEEQGFFSIEKLSREFSTVEPPVEVREDDDCEILYTSGTTGFPKGALFDHHRIIHVGYNMIAELGINSFDRILHVAPLFHSAQLNLFLNSGLHVGATHVIVRQFEPGQVLRLLAEEKITFFFGVPAMYAFMLNHPDFSKYDFSHIKRFGYGAAPMPVSLIKLAMEKFKSDQFYNLCGLTEAGPGGILLRPHEHKNKLGASGKAIINTEAKVVNDRGEEVKPGEIGEFILRGETIMKAYYSNPQATTETIKDGWLYTGDLATVDEDGYITLVDRKKDMIITGGENVYSTEVEQVVTQHPAVFEAAVIGVPHPVWGETVTAVVVLKPGHSLTIEELREFCRDKLADYKIPRILKLVEALPRNASGKILKYRLREELKNL